MSKISVEYALDQALKITKILAANPSIKKDLSKYGAEDIAGFIKTLTEKLQEIEVTDL